MKKVNFVIACLFLLSVEIFAGMDIAEGSWVATLVMKTGDLKITTSDNKSVRAKKGMKLTSGSTLITEKNILAAIKTSDGSLVKINEKTELKIASADKIKVILGEIFCKVKERKELEIITPSCVCAVRGTELNVKVKANGETEIFVFDGTVEIKNDYGRTVLSKGKMVKVRKKKSPSKPAALKEKDKPVWQEKIEISVKSEIEETIVIEEEPEEEIIEEKEASPYQP